MNRLYELKEKLMNELEEYGSQEEMTAGTLDVVDKLAHTIKNLCKIIDDEEYHMDGGSMRRGSYSDGSMRGGSYDRYSRGRGRGARRDSMGRYSSNSDMMLEQLQELMQDAPDERSRQEIQKLVTKFEQM